MLNEFVNPFQSNVLYLSLVSWIFRENAMGALSLNLLMKIFKLHKSSEQIEKASTLNFLT